MAQVPAARRMALLPLIGATYFMVSGGPYGLEDIIGMAGYGRALLILAAVPFLWSLPTALMVGELASTLPDDGGFYVWVRRAMGRFWGFQEAWLSLAASVFDMAIYPVLFVDYLGRVAPGVTAGYRGTLCALVVVIGCAYWNSRGAKSVGDSSVAMFVILLTPFVVLVVVALWRWHAHGHGALLQPVTTPDMAGAISVAMWNYMGWDNASTVAQEVDNPQKNYPRAMIGSAFLVAITYIIPLGAVALAGLAPDQFTTGAWVDAARTIVGPALGLAIVVGGMINGVGMFNPLMMSYTRLPYAMAEDGLMPRAMLKRNKAGAPWVSIVACAIIWALALRMNFERLISIDLVLYGASLILEFVALVVLRIREPNLERPFRVPGGLAGAIGIGVAPTILIFFALWAARTDRMFASETAPQSGINALLFASIVAALGAIIYVLINLFNKKPPMDAGVERSS